MRSSNVVLRLVAMAAVGGGVASAAPPTSGAPDPDPPHRGRGVNRLHNLPAVAPSAPPVQPVSPTYRRAWDWYRDPFPLGDRPWAHSEYWNRTRGADTGYWRNLYGTGSYYFPPGQFSMPPNFRSYSNPIWWSYGIPWSLAYRWDDTRYPVPVPQILPPDYALPAGRGVIGGADKPPPEAPAVQAALIASPDWRAADEAVRIAQAAVTAAEQRVIDSLRNTPEYRDAEAKEVEAHSRAREVIAQGSAAPPTALADAAAADLAANQALAKLEESAIGADAAAVTARQDLAAALVRRADVRQKVLADLARAPK